VLLALGPQLQCTTAAQNPSRCVDRALLFPSVWLPPAWVHLESYSVSPWRDGCVWRVPAALASEGGRDTGQACQCC
jgi:hypothetical protein